uniref:Uncharacterized protein n=1 Tax=Cyanothece sp. (strain PCC 7425 / ATCC 29141) TaxID=395961 RepID=B8HVM7_CYAP4
MKTLSPRFRFNGQVLFWLGPLLLVAGFSARIVSGNWNGVPLGLLIAGMAILILWLIWQARVSAGFWGRRSTQVGTNALLSTLAVLVILGLLNFIAVRYPLRLDLTEAQLLSLAPQSQQVLANLKQPVKVLIFNPTPPSEARQLLEQYKRRSQSKFSFEFIDPQAEPGLVEKYKVQNIGDAFIESGDRVQPLQGTLTEVNLTPAIEQIGSDRRSKAYVTLGHGELAVEGGQDSLAAAVAALQQKNITVESLNLLTAGKIPADANVVIVAGPKRPFLPAEVKILEDYLKTGGSALLLLDPLVQTGLEPLLKTWGVEVDNRLVVDASGAGQLVGLGPGVALVNQYGDHPITRNFNRGFSFFPLAQALTVQPKGDEQVTGLLQTSEQSWAEANAQERELKLDPQRDRKGPLTLGVAITRPLSQSKDQTKETKKEARLVVIGDSDFATDNAFAQSLNGDVLLNSVAWLSDRTDQTLSIRPKEPTNRRLQMTEAKGRWVSWLSLGVLPFGAFFAAIGLWWQRR